MKSQQQKRKQMRKYTYNGAVFSYSHFKGKEINTTLNLREESEALIVRLDGKGLTKRFRTDKAYNPEFQSAMEYVIKEIANHCQILFAYSTSDELSLLVNLEYIKNKEINNRLEKLLTYLSGFVSSLFTIGLHNSSERVETVSFDARAIIIEQKEIKKYFLCRQWFSVWKFMEKLCSIHNFEKHGYTIQHFDDKLKTKGDSWANYPNSVPYGVVGFYNNNEWITHSAKDFETEWSCYSNAINAMHKA